MYRLDGKVALITGAASGIGRAIALRLAEEGCDAGLLDRDADGAEVTAGLVQDHRRRAAVAPCDVADGAAVADAARLLERALGPADVLVNSAGILRIGPLLDLAEDDWHLLFGVNVDGTFNVCRAVVPGMVARGHGRVINISSWLGKQGMRYYGAYCATKFAVIGFTQALALELAADGVTVNAICPGTIVETGMRSEAEVVHRTLGLPSVAERTANIPLGRAGVPDDVARMAAFLASDESAYMTGQAINVTGGLWLH